MSVTACYLVPGLPHVLLAPERSPGWMKLRIAFEHIRQEIEHSDAEMILYFSSQWLSVLGYLFQADENPKWTHVDHNWHELGSMKYEFKIDTKFATLFAAEVKAMGHYTRAVNYRGFPIDTGTIVAQKLLNPANRYSAAIASCNMYAEKQETLSIGQAAMRTIEKSGRRVAVVVISGLSSRFDTVDIEPAHDRISSRKDDEWNRKILEILAEGRLEDVSEVAREYARQANADMGFRGIWWLNGLCGKTNDFSGRLFEYQPIWGTGAAALGLYPTRAIASIPDWRNDEPDLVERSQAQIASRNLSQASEGANTATVPGQGCERLIKEVVGGTSDGPISSPLAPPPVGPYPHARREGEFLFLSGCGPRKAGSKEIPGVELDANGNVTSYDIAIQTRSVLENIKLILAASGAELRQIIDVQVYLTNMKSDFSTFNKIYGEYFSNKIDDIGNPMGPCRTTIEVGALPTPIAVELKVVARLPPTVA